MHRIKRKSRKQTDEEITNLVQHLAQQRLFEISNEVENQTEFSKIQQPAPGQTRQQSPISRSTLLRSGDKRMRQPRFMTPLQSRNITRRVNIINYSHSSMPTAKNYQLKDPQGNTVYIGSLKQQQYWFEPVKNFTRFIILDNRELRDEQKPNDAMPMPRVNKGLYRSNLFRKTKEQSSHEQESSSALFQLPRPQDLIGSRYRPTKQVIHSIYNEYRNYSSENIQRRQPTKKH